MDELLIYVFAKLLSGLLDTVISWTSEALRSKSKTRRTIP